ncbi:hypothetical protein D9613_006467 [Agrocybe pediades]|uniref:Uncharacterized protein n=1 Tax=Agrocybe pediades TaxID=84607 RepID=A0A8H4QHD5_9AGAR|nr:hypothetical protein D9613_006467 [Agrocybe pediades]
MNNHSNHSDTNISRTNEKSTRRGGAPPPPYMYQPQTPSQRVRSISGSTTTSTHSSTSRRSALPTPPTPPRVPSQQNSSRPTPTPSPTPRRAASASATGTPPRSRIPSLTPPRVPVSTSKLTPSPPGGRKPSLASPLPPSPLVPPPSSSSPPAHANTTQSNGRPPPLPLNQTHGRRLSLSSPPSYARTPASVWQNTSLIPLAKPKDNTPPKPTLSNGNGHISKPSVNLSSIVVPDSPSTGEMMRRVLGAPLVPGPVAADASKGGGDGVGYAGVGVQPSLSYAVSREESTSARRKTISAAATSVLANGQSTATSTMNAAANTTGESTKFGLIGRTRSLSKPKPIVHPVSDKEKEGEKEKEKEKRKPNVLRRRPSITNPSGPSSPAFNSPAFSSRKIPMPSPSATPKMFLNPPPTPGPPRDVDMAGRYSHDGYKDTEMDNAYGGIQLVNDADSYNSRISSTRPLLAETALGGAHGPSHPDHVEDKNRRFRHGHGHENEDNGHGSTAFTNGPGGLVEAHSFPTAMSGTSNGASTGGGGLGLASDHSGSGMDYSGSTHGAFLVPLPSSLSSSPSLSPSLSASGVHVPAKGGESKIGSVFDQHQQQLRREHHQHGHGQELLGREVMQDHREGTGTAGAGRSYQHQSQSQSGSVGSNGNNNSFGTSTNHPIPHHQHYPLSRPQPSTSQPQVQHSPSQGPAPQAQPNTPQHQLHPQLQQQTRLHTAYHQLTTPTPQAQVRIPVQSQSQLPRLYPRREDTSMSSDYTTAPTSGTPSTSTSAFTSAAGPSGSTTRKPVLSSPGNIQRSTSASATLSKSAHHQQKHQQQQSQHPHHQRLAVPGQDRYPHPYAIAGANGSSSSSLMVPPSPSSSVGVPGVAGPGGSGRSRSAERGESERVHQERGKDAQREKEKEPEKAPEKKEKSKATKRLTSLMTSLSLPHTHKSMSSPASSSPVSSSSSPSKSQAKLRLSGMNKSSSTLGSSNSHLQTNTNANTNTAVAANVSATLGALLPSSPSASNTRARLGPSLSPSSVSAARNKPSSLAEEAVEQTPASSLVEAYKRQERERERLERLARGEEEEEEVQVTVEDHAGDELHPVEERTTKDGEEKKEDNNLLKRPVLMSVDSYYGNTNANATTNTGTGTNEGHQSLSAGTTPTSVWVESGKGGRGGKVDGGLPGPGAGAGLNEVERHLRMQLEKRSGLDMMKAREMMMAPATPAASSHQNEAQASTTRPTPLSVAPEARQKAAQSYATTADGDSVFDLLARARAADEDDDDLPRRGGDDRERHQEEGARQAEGGGGGFEVLERTILGNHGTTSGNDSNAHVSAGMTNMNADANVRDSQASTATNPDPTPYYTVFGSLNWKSDGIVNGLGSSLTPGPASVGTPGGLPSAPSGSREKEKTSARKTLTKKVSLSGLGLFGRGAGKEEGMNSPVTPSRGVPRPSLQLAGGGASAGAGAMGGLGGRSVSVQAAGMSGGGAGGGRGRKSEDGGHRSSSKLHHSQSHGHAQQHEQHQRVPRRSFTEDPTKASKRGVSRERVGGRAMSRERERAGHGHGQGKESISATLSSPVSASPSGSSNAGGGRFWKLMKRISVGGGLRDKYQHDQGATAGGGAAAAEGGGGYGGQGRGETPPPVPALPELKHLVGGGLGNIGGIVNLNADIGGPASKPPSSSTSPPPQPSPTHTNANSTPTSAHPGMGRPSTTTRSSSPNTGTSVFSSEELGNSTSSRSFKYFHRTISAKSSNSSLGEELPSGSKIGGGLRRVDISGSDVNVTEHGYDPSVASSSIPTTNTSSMPPTPSTEKDKDKNQLRMALGPIVLPAQRLTKRLSKLGLGTSSSSTSGGSGGSSPLATVVPGGGGMMDRERGNDEWTIVRTPSVELPSLPLPPSASARSRKAMTVLVTGGVANGASGQIYVPGGGRAKGKSGLKAPRRTAKGKDASGEESASSKGDEGSETENEYESESDGLVRPPLNVSAVALQRRFSTPDGHLHPSSARSPVHNYSNGGYGTSEYDVYRHVDPRLSMTINESARFVPEPSTSSQSGRSSRVSNSRLSSSRPVSSVLSPSSAYPSSAGGFDGITGGIASAVGGGGSRGSLDFDFGSSSASTVRGEEEVEDFDDDEYEEEEDWGFTTEGAINAFPPRRRQSSRRPVMDDDDTFEIGGPCAGSGGYGGTDAGGYGGDVSPTIPSFVVDETEVVNRFKKVDRKGGDAAADTSSAVPFPSTSSRSPARDAEDESSGSDAESESESTPPASATSPSIHAIWTTPGTDTISTMNTLSSSSPPPHVVHAPIPAQTIISPASTSGTSPPPRPQRSAQRPTPPAVGGMTGKNSSPSASHGGQDPSSPNLLTEATPSVNLGHTARQEASERQPQHKQHEENAAMMERTRMKHDSTMSTDTIRPSPSAMVPSGSGRPEGQRRSSHSHAMSVPSASVTTSSVSSSSSTTVASSSTTRVAVGPGSGSKSTPVSPVIGPHMKPAFNLPSSPVPFPSVHRTTTSTVTATSTNMNASDQKSRKGKHSSSSSFSKKLSKSFSSLSGHGHSHQKSTNVPVPILPSGRASTSSAATRPSTAHSEGRKSMSAVGKRPATAGGEASPTSAVHYSDSSRSEDSGSGSEWKELSMDRDQDEVEKQKNKYALTEEEKAERWADLLLKSEKAGGTLHIDVGIGF